ncbi:MAG: DMT family transporter [Myxococcota bacterium]|nr:DMT family transporter [Myxococcota bacterium]
MLPLIQCLAAALLFGLTVPATKALLPQSGPLVVAGLLYLGAALGALPFARPKPEQDLRPPRKEWARLGGAVLFGGVLGPAALVTAMTLGSGASISLWLNLETVATAVLAVLFFKENMGRWEWLACAGVLAGGVLLAAEDGFSAAPAAALVAAACLCWGLDNNLTATIDRFTPAQSTFAKGAVAGSVNLGLGLLFSQQLPAWSTVALLLGIGAVGYGLSLVLYITGAQQLGATRSQLAFSTAPFLGAIASLLLLSEALLWQHLAAGGVLIGSLALLFAQQHAHDHHHHALTHTHRHRHDDDHHDHTHDPPVAGWHSHEHAHAPKAHSHAHSPDLHHRHEH